MQDGMPSRAGEGFHLEVFRQLADQFIPIVATDHVRLLIGTVLGGGGGGGGDGGLQAESVLKLLALVLHLIIQAADLSGLAAAAVLVLELELR